MFGFVVLLLGLPADASAETTPASDDPPTNFVFILSDDVAQGDLGCYGQDLIQTPHLDRMAAEGTRFLQAYCGTSVCAPSRSSFFTGLHSGHCPVRGNVERPPEGQYPLPDETMTIAEVAKHAGYATGTFGKWGMGMFGTSGDPRRQGVDRFYGYNCQRHAHSYFPTYLWDDATPVALPGNDGRTVGETYAQELIQQAMIEWVRGHAEQPFFLFYAITLPHGRHEIDDVGAYAAQPWTKEQKSYAAQVSRLDADVGQLLEPLRENGVAERTLVVFCGDNGSSFSPESELGRRFEQASNGLRGYKRSLYEGALRQAALAWQPGTVPAGRVSDEPWAFWDLLPTFVELSGTEPPAGVRTDGRSLVSYFAGGAAPQRPHFYWELHLGKHVTQAVRFGDWKAIRGRLEQPLELYDLASDPGEQRNVADEHPELIEQAARLLEAEHEPHPDWPLEGRPKAISDVAAEAWTIKRRRDREGYVPPNAKPLPTN